MKRLSASEIIFKIVAYVIATAFALVCIYPVIYTFSAAISGADAYYTGNVVFFPVDVQFDAVLEMLVGLKSLGFWIAYTNTLFYTLYGTLYSIIISIFAAYALSRRNLVFKKQINFLIVFTMWFSAGIMPTFLNYQNLYINNRWGIIVGFGVQAFNVILLRNFFNGIPREIEEAAIVDGAGEFKVLTRIYLPMSKSAIATVTLFYALARWNGYFWNRRLVLNEEHPLQVILRTQLGESIPDDPSSLSYAPQSLMFAMILMSIIPIIVVYPYIQKYFAAGVNVGGVKG